MFIGLPVACFVFARLFARQGKRGWAIYSAVSGLGMLAAFVVTSMGFNQQPGLADFAGLFQRLTIVIGWAWVAMLAVHWLH